MGYQQPPVPQQPQYPYQSIPAPIPKKNKVWLWVVGLIGAVALCGCAGFVAVSMAGSHTSNTGTLSSNTSSTSTTSSTSSQQTQPQHFKAGQTVKVGDTWEVTVNSIKTSQGQQFDTPKTGNVFLLVDVTLKNVSNQEQPVSSLVMFTLRDSTGLQYTESITTFTTAPDGKAAAGSPVRGTLVYEVPTSLHSFDLAFIASLLDSGQTIWDVNI